MSGYTNRQTEKIELAEVRGPRVIPAQREFGNNTGKVAKAANYIRSTS